MKLLEKKILPLLVVLGAGYVAAQGARGAVMMATAATLALTFHKIRLAREPVRVRANASRRAKLATNFRKRF
jgi:hypothetical protein